MLSNWRNPPRPGEKSPEQGRPYNRQPREVGRRREGGGWVRTSVKIPKYQYVGFDLSLSTRRGKRRRGDWIGGSSGRTSSSDRVADRCKAAATFAGDFSVSDRAHGSCRAGADYSGLFGRPVGLRRGARDRSDAADGDTLSRASQNWGVIEALDDRPRAGRDP